MLLMKSKILTVMLLVLAFLGQAASATVVPCEQNPGLQTVYPSMTTMTHSDSSANDDAGSLDIDRQSDMADCCEPDGNCPSGGCITAMLPSIPGHNWEVAELQKDSPSQFLVLGQSPLSLYRPPISG